MRLAMLVTCFAGVAAAAPCTRGAAECTEPFPMRGERFVTMYRSHPLTVPNAAARRALVVIHGSGRNADDYFASGMAAAFLAGPLEETVVVAPRFAGTGGTACEDVLAEGEIGFACVEDDWRGGGPGAGVARVTTYDVMDALVRRLADKRLFPELRQVVLMGHSAGGQYLSRYAAAARPAPAGVAVRYVIANPSSYLYLDRWRPAPVAGCAGFNRWKYGMERRTGYAAKIPDETMRRNLVERDVVYLLGGYDVTPQFGFDTNCEAVAQGANRLERGKPYFEYITGRHGARHRLVVVPSCGHSGRCMLVANESRPVLFP
jgi:pimeloyl-ACP methyl ester carboxylesterase